MSGQRQVRTTGRGRAAVGLLVLSALCVGAACVPRGAVPPKAGAPSGPSLPAGDASNLTALSFSQVACIADQPLDGLSNERPPTLDEIARVLAAAAACGFIAPRGYAAEYAEHLTGTAAPRTTMAPTELPYLANAQIKCLADQRLTGLVVGSPPAAAELQRVRAAVGACGLQLR